VLFREDELMADGRARWALRHGKDENGEDVGPEAEMEEDNVDDRTYIYIVGCTYYIAQLQQPSDSHPPCALSSKILLLLSRFLSLSLSF